MIFEAISETQAIQRTFSDHPQEWTTLITSCFHAPFEEFFFFIIAGNKKWEFQSEQKIRVAGQDMRYVTTDRIATTVSASQPDNGYMNNTSGPGLDSPAG